MGTGSLWSDWTQNEPVPFWVDFDPKLTRPQVGQKKGLTKAVYCCRLKARFIVIDQKGYGALRVQSSVIIDKKGGIIMEQLKLCASDYKFMCIVWENSPIPSGDLVKKCFEGLGWKKSTTYTMVKKMAEKGYLKNEGSIVTALISKGEVQAFESEYVVNNTFEGSLPAFIAAFIGNKKLTEKEAEEIRRLIDESPEG